MHVYNYSIIHRTDAENQIPIPMGPLLADVCQYPMPGSKVPRDPGPQVHCAPAGPKPRRNGLVGVRSYLQSPSSVRYHHTVEYAEPISHGHNRPCHLIGDGHHTIYPHCQAADHRGEDCALLSVDPFLDSLQTRTHRSCVTPQQSMGGCRI